MAQFAPSKNLLRVTKAKKAEIALWKEGRFLEAETKRTLEELLDRAAADRFQLAVDFMRIADRLVRAEPPFYRFAVSRYYYAMYHGMRAAVFFFHGGDDFEEHRTLPGKAPDDLPNQGLWANALKDARERRNAADYNPYPKGDPGWQQTALDLKTESRRFLTEVKTYLNGKGCRYL